MLPVSKTDVQANGCRRTWGCVCKNPISSSTCPYHAALRLKAELGKRFGDQEGNLPIGCPLFPDEAGGWCTRDGFVNTIAVMAHKLKLPTVDPQERSTLGEHVWRVTGARHLAGLDVPVPVIKLLARWGGDIIERYVAEAPLSALTRIYVDRVQASEAAVRGTSAAASDESVPGLASLCSGEDGVSNCRGSPSTSDHMEAKLYPFVSSITGKVHLVSLPPHLGRTDQGRTPCGWRYLDSDHTLIDEIPSEAKCCERCGNERTWASAHALYSQISCGYESE
jgi:hypothetical protein